MDTTLLLPNGFTTSKTSYNLEVIGGIATIVYYMDFLILMLNKLLFLNKYTI